jgi:hypothetical protein
MFEKATKIIIIAIIIIVVGYDIAVAILGNEGETISEILYGYSLRFPVIPFSFGFLMGHLFWPVKPVEWFLKRKKNAES